MVLVVVVVAVVLVRAHLASGTSNTPAITSAPDDGQARQAAALLSAQPPPTPAVTPPPGLPATAVRAMVQALPAETPVAQAGGLQLLGAGFPTTGSGGASLTRVDGPAAGFDILPLPPWYQTMQPGANQFAPLASGDVNGDGRLDVAVGTAAGVLLYVNVGGHFVQQHIDFPAMNSWTITAVALVDLDGDNAPDLVFCAWMQGCHILFNRGGSFSVADQVEFPRLKEVAVQALAFGDWDHNGRVDIVTGASSYLEWNFYPANDVDVIWHNQGGGHFTPEKLPGPEGETISLFLASLNGMTGGPALYVGNDFDEPDRLFVNNNGAATAVTAAKSPFPYSTTTTMSLDSADIQNTGKPFVYIAQIAQKGASPAVASEQNQPPGPACDALANDAEHTACLQLAQYQAAVTTARDQSDVSQCAHLGDPALARQCAAIGYSWNEAFVTLPEAGGTRSAVLDECGQVPADFVQFKNVCQEAAQVQLDGGTSQTRFPNEMRQVADTNLLMAPGGSGYSDVTAKFGVGFGGWTWNAKFADLDNDTWQDLYMTQGTRLRFTNASNILYRNIGGTHFEDDTQKFGLEDHLPSGASLFIDADLDGRQDIVTYPFALTPILWHNQLAPNPGLELTLRDDRSQNRAAIGARVVIHSSDGRMQMRDIKASGGYESFDAPMADFGLGNWGSVAAVDVTWPDGQVQHLDGLSLAAGRYTLVRGAA